MAFVGFDPVAGFPTIRIPASERNWWIAVSSLGFRQDLPPDAKLGLVLAYFDANGVPQGARTRILDALEDRGAFDEQGLPPSPEPEPVPPPDDVEVGAPPLLEPVGPAPIDSPSAGPGAPIGLLGFPAARIPAPVLGSAGAILTGLAALLGALAGPAIRGGRSLLRRGRGGKITARPRGKAGGLASGVATGALVGSLGPGGGIQQQGGPPVAGRRSRKSDVVRVSEMEQVVGLLTNPLYAFLLGFITIEILQEQKVVGDVAGSVAEAALGGIAYAQALSPLVDRLGPAATSLAPRPGV